MKRFFVTDFRLNDCYLFLHVLLVQNFFAKKLATFQIAIWKIKFFSVSIFFLQEDGRFSVEVETGDNTVTILCANLLLANNAWLPQLLPEMRSFLQPCTNCVVASSNPAPEALRWGFSAFAVGDGASEVYGSMTSSGHVVIGGLRELSENKAIGRDTTTPRDSDAVTCQNLKECFASRFPDLSREIELDIHWVGVMSVTSDGLPVVGEVDRGLFCSAGFNGHGMPRCFGVARLLVKRVLGEEMTEAEREVLDNWNVQRVRR